MDLSVIIKSGIHAVSSALEIPAIIVLIIVMAITVFQLGTLLVEFFGDRMGNRLDAPGLLEKLAQDRRTGGQNYMNLIETSGFQKKQKAAFRRLVGNVHLDGEEKRLFATQVLTDEEKRLERRIAATDAIARIAPMFGLMATLIPLGPGLISLGQGDTKGLADSLLTAFDATVAGLVSAGVAFIISKVRKRWYMSDIAAMETVLQEVIR